MEMHRHLQASTAKASIKFKTLAHARCTFHIACCVLQVYHQSGEDGAISTLRAATDPEIEGQGFKYFGPFYKGPLLLHTGNESMAGHPLSVLCLSQ